MVEQVDIKVLSSVAKLSDAVRRCPHSELLAHVRSVEEAVVRGTAQMRDYELFVRCKEELMRREFHSNSKRASKS